MPLQLPPLDQHNQVSPHDHSGIDSEHNVIRRVSDKQLVVDKSGKRRISSIAFRASSGANAGMSVDLEALIVEANLDPRLYVTTPVWIGSVYFCVGNLRAEGFMVGFHPLTENPYHGEVWGSFTKDQQRRLAEIASWYVEIPGASIV